MINRRILPEPATITYERIMRRVCDQLFPESGEPISIEKVLNHLRSDAKDSGFSEPARRFMNGLASTLSQDSKVWIIDLSYVCKVNHIRRPFSLVQAAKKRKS